MSIPLQALIAEDSEEDALLLLRELRKGGYDTTSERVETPEGFREALERGAWDIVLCDYTFPRFSGKEALKIFKETGRDLPFIFVSGTIGEESAVEAMKAGAHDYVIKNRLSRLCPAVERELREAAERRAGREAEESMRSSENKYRHLFEALSDAAFVIEEQSGRIIDTNAQAGILLGRARENILGSNQSLLFAPQCAPGGIAALRSAAGSGQTGGCEMEIIRSDGKAVPVHVSASRLELYGRQLLLALLRDVSDRNRMDEQLRQLSRAVEQSPVSITITDLDGKITYVNPRFTALTGYTLKEAVGKNPRILKSGETPPETYREMWATISSGREWRGCFHNRRKNGELFWESALISPIINKAGKITHYLAVEVDIDESRPGTP